MGLIYSMKSLKYFPFTGWMLLSLLSAYKMERIAFKETRVLSVHRGLSVNFCFNSFPLNIITVGLQKNNKTLCLYIRLESWINQSCDDHIRFIWIPETNEILFELSNLQINDTGTYSCTVRRLAPPPEMILWEERTTVNVFAHPHVSMSCVKDPDGFPMILCSSEGFYPSDLELVWLRDGQFKNITQTHNTSRTNPDGSITLHSYLHSSYFMSEYNYSCLVNHSSLNKPVVLHLSSTECYARLRGLSYSIILAMVTSALITLILLILILLCHPLRICRKTPQDVSVLDSELHTVLLYHPVSLRNSHIRVTYAPNMD